MKKVLFFSCFLYALTSSSQTIWKEFKHLECPHKIWAITHLLKAKKAFIISEEANRVTDSISKTFLLNNNTSGGQLDAFRHAYWMARLHQEIGKNSARKLGIAHEKSNYLQYKKKLLEDGEVPDKISSEMDLYNNQIGLTFTRKREIYPKKGLVFRIINAILNGEMKIIKKDINGNFLTCNGTIIPKNSLAGSWENNKCLVNSNR